MMPGMGKMKNQIAAANLDDKMFKRQIAMITSMTKAERANPDILKAQPQEAHRRRLGHRCRRDQQAAQDASRHGRHDEGHGAARAKAPA
jgi:signal recognition particle GTPase